MISIPGYTIKEQLYNGDNSIIYKGIRNSDSRNIIIKLSNKEYPTIAELATIKREYELTIKPYGDKVINVYGIEKINNTIAIIMEDFDGKSLAEILHTVKLNLKEKLLLAVKITDALNQIHKQGVIHKDINPSNIIWNIETNQIKMIDFGLSTHLNNESPQTLSILEGTIPYISPEQTGKIYRFIDYRSDLYSLGITFYEIFTGRLPFYGDNIEVIHGHIAKEPKKPIEIDTEIPLIISNIILKLISKNAEDRYQSALGLKFDLEYCLTNLNSKENLKCFTIGKNDVSERFQIPQKLYGREKEVNTLINTIDNIDKNQTGLLLVSGYSGIGKTAVIQEIINAVINKGGRFLSGKFEQLRHNNPYSAINLAFRGLIKNLILETKYFDMWKEKLLNALGVNGNVIIGLIPELEQLIGKQPELAKLSPNEEKNRFQLVFRDFISVFASKEHPLVIFLDDLQWSDLSTLDLLKYLLTATDINNLLFIGAYRDNEVKQGHQLLQILEDIKSHFGNSDSLHQLFIEPLKEEALNQMIADTLNYGYSDTFELTTLLYQKTKGNPFFTKQLLKSLYEKGIIWFDEEKRKWNWNLLEIKESQISDNVLGFLVENLNSLPSDSLEVLKLASCIGNYFDLKILYLIDEKIKNINDSLLYTIEREFIIPLNSNYKLLTNILKDQFLDSNTEMKFRFNHDRIQQAVYSLVSDKEKAYIHQKIGNILLESHLNDNLAGNTIFELTNHLNIARSLIKTKKDRIRLSDLNYRSGKMAKSSSAYDIAKNYFGIGKSLLSKLEWNDYPDKFFDISLEYIESSYLSGDTEEVIEMCSDLYESVTDIVKKAKIHNLKAKVLDFKGDKREIVIEEIRKGLKLFAINLPSALQEIEAKVNEGIGKMQRHLERIAIDELVNLPRMEDQNKIMAMNLLTQALPVAFQTCLPLYILIQLTIFDISLKYGITEVSCKNLVDLGLTQGPILGNYEAAYKLSKAAFNLIDIYKAESQKSASYYVFACFLSHWRAHFKESLEYYDLSIKSGLETGDLQCYAYSLTHRIHRNIYVGKNLSDCKLELETFIKDNKALLLVLFNEIMQHTVNQLQLDYNEENDRCLLDKIFESNIMLYFCIFGEFNLMVNYILGNMEAADKWNDFTNNYLSGGVGLFSQVDHYMFQSLVLIKKFEKVSKNEQNEIIIALNKNLADLKKWAENCPSNFAHKYYVVAAELAGMNQEPLEKITSLYKKAVDSISPDEFIHMRAIIYELVGEFYLKREDEIAGKAYLKEAYYFYTQWGAFAKTAKLEKKYSEIFTNYHKSIITNNLLISKHFNNSSMSLDFMSIFKIAQAISSEIKFDNLLKVLMKTIIENAGAQNGCIILTNNTDNKLYVRAVKNKDLEEISIMEHPTPISDSHDFCPEILQYVIRTGENIVIDKAYKNPDYENYDYIKSKKIKSVLCTPIIYQNNLKGVIYLENNLTVNVFNIERFEIIKILSSQVAISIENAQLYEKLEEKVNERTKQLELANIELKELTLHDPLTKLHNRRYMYEFISSVAENFIKEKTLVYFNNQKRDSSIGANVLGVFLIDIDNFKKVNDTFGHAAGDEVLKNIANILRNIIRKDDFIIRWGGEEFLIILNKTKLEYLDMFSKKVLDAVGKNPTKLPNDMEITKTCSIGFTSLPLDTNFTELLSLEQTINLCDFALYKAKQSGKDCAIYISLKKVNDIKQDNLKSYLTNLTQDNCFNDKFFNLKYIKA